MLTLDTQPHSAIRVQIRVIGALMLRDMRTRFFGHGLGYLIAVGWPLAHVAVLLIIYRLVGRVQPIGDSLELFFATGLSPYIAFIYMARFIMMAMQQNRPLTSLPIVKLTDIVFARAILEFLNACTVTIVLMTTLYILNVNVVPRDIPQAYMALGSSMLFGFGFGIVNALISAAVPGWMIVFIGFQILCYATSGIMFMADTLPEIGRIAISYNPIFHGVEWMRMAFYEGYTSSALDKSYLLSWGVGSLIVGLVVERAVRGRILQG